MVKTPKNDDESPGFWPRALAVLWSCAIYIVDQTRWCAKRYHLKVIRSRTALWLLAMAVVLAACSSTATVDVSAAGDASGAGEAVGDAPATTSTTTPSEVATTTTTEAPPPPPPPGRQVIAEAQANGQPYVLWFWGVN